MKVYKILHKPSGLYLKPNQGPYLKSNFSKKGKIYKMKPSFDWFRGPYSRDKNNLELFHEGILKKYPASDFEIVEYNLEKV